MDKHYYKDKRLYGECDEVIATWSRPSGLKVGCGYIFDTQLLNTKEKLKYVFEHWMQDKKIPINADFELNYEPISLKDLYDYFGF